MVVRPGSGTGAGEWPIIRCHLCLEVAIQLGDFRGIGGIRRRVDVGIAAVGHGPQLFCQEHQGRPHKIRHEEPPFALVGAGNHGLWERDVIPHRHAGAGDAGDVPGVAAVCHVVPGGALLVYGRRLAVDELVAQESTERDIRQTRIDPLELRDHDGVVLPVFLVSAGHYCTSSSVAIVRSPWTRFVRKSAIVRPLV